MIKTLEDVIARVRAWPKQRQEAAARVLEQMEAIGTGVYALSPEEHADLEQALEELRAGEVSSEAEVAEFFNRHRG